MVLRDDGLGKETLYSQGLKTSSDFNHGFQAKHMRLHLLGCSPVPRIENHLSSAHNDFVTKILADLGNVFIDKLVYSTFVRPYNHFWYLASLVQEASRGVENDLEVER